MNTRLEISSPPSPSSAEPSLLPGVKVLLEGPTGTGKTYSIGTLVDTGIETFYLGIDSGMEALLGFFTDSGRAIPPNLRWHQMSTSDPPFEAMIQSAEQTNRNTFESLTKVQDPRKADYNHFVTLLRALVNFHDDRTGADFGPIDSWGPNRVLVIDALTGINTCARALVVGAKPVIAPGEWQVAMDHIEKLLKKLIDTRCHFVLLAHVEREMDEVLGGTKITVGTLGKRLAPKIPPMFSDVILAERQGASWTWTTANNLADLKTRNLPVANGLQPTFRAILDRWESRGGRRSPTVRS